MSYEGYGYEKRAWNAINLDNSWKACEPGGDLVHTAVYVFLYI